MGFEADVVGVELWARRAGALLGLATLAVAVVAMIHATLRRPSREEGSASRYLRWTVLLPATALFLGVGFALWRPLPLLLSAAVRLAVLLLGTSIFLAGLGLYLWGMATLGAMFAPSTGFGVRLQAEHRLVTSGPFSRVRHPMYLAVILSFFGGLLLFRTWTMLVFAVCMLGLVVRARREEALLAAEFGEAWRAWSRQVPAWVPHLRRTAHTNETISGR
jgi:protein-S-isoprenylcysteine O-methyltransferase Ste14